MSRLNRMIRLIWRILTFPIWFPWLVIKRFGRQIWRLATAVWKGIVWSAKLLWKLLTLYLKYIYWVPAKFVFYHVPRWIYRRILTPIGYRLDSLNTLIAHGVYRILSSWTERKEVPPQEDFDELPTPQLETKSFADCTMCRMETPHTVERISGAVSDTLETCDRCGSRQAGRWQDQDIPLLENYA